MIPSPPLASVRYTLDWSWEDTVSQTGETGFAVESDLGFLVRVESGALISHTLQLVPCESPSPDSGLLGRLRRQVLPSAWASDSSAHDPSASPEPVAEGLGEPQESTLGPVVLEESIYCQLHYLVAPSEFGGTSLTLEAQVETAEGSLPLSISTPTAWAEMWPLGEVVPTDPEEPIHLEIQAARRLASLFDGIDFSASLEEEDMARAILRNLFQGTTIDAHPTDAR